MFSLALLTFLSYLRWGVETFESSLIAQSAIIHILDVSLIINSVISSHSITPRLYLWGENAGMASDGLNLLNLLKSMRK